MNQPSDILCLDHVGVWKTTILEIPPGRSLRSNPKIDRGAKILTCCEVKQKLPKKDGSIAKVHIQFWDSKGIEKWSKEDSTIFFFSRT
jgi:hypothetical protein